LWEKEFYEDGKSIAQRISEQAAKVDRATLSALAIEARKVHNLRHVPLLLLCELAKKGGSGVADTIAEVISRADELTELLAVYWRNGKCPISKQMKLGLAKAFLKFDEYQLAKYNRDGAIKLRDVLFLCHAKPLNKEQADLFLRLTNNTLATPDTWEVALSGGADKKQAFTRLLQEGKLGYMALLRNLRNMEQVGVDRDLVKDALLSRKGAQRVLPFRFTAAARACPAYEAALDKAMMFSIEALPKLDGTTIVLVDVSGSMDAKLSVKSDLTRADAAATLASIINADDLRVFSFSERTVEVPARKGMAGVEAILKSQRHYSTNLREALDYVNTLKHNRLIVITDEQASSRIPAPVCKNAYMINVASARNGVGYGKDWVHIDGFSENVLKFVHEMEK
jgi:hypothetical protein